MQFVSEMCCLSALLRPNAVNVCIARVLRLLHGSVLIHNMLKHHNFQVIYATKIDFKRCKSFVCAHLPLWVLIHHPKGKYKWRIQRA